MVPLILNDRTTFWLDFEGPALPQTAEKIVLLDEEIQNLQDSYLLQEAIESFSKSFVLDLKKLTHEQKCILVNHTGKLIALEGIQSMDQFINFTKMTPNIFCIWIAI